jgi:ferredoxin
MCAKACPKGLIKLIPYENKEWVACSSKEKGIDTRKVCNAGCIACGICVKNCPENAIILFENIAKIDYEKCTGCGLCAKACHEGAIGMLNGKAKLMRDDYCDGLGDCLPACKTMSITKILKGLSLLVEGSLGLKWLKT